MNNEEQRAYKREWMRKWRAEHPEASREKAWAYRLKHPEVGKAWHAAHPERGKASKLKCNYRMTVEQFEAMRAVQKNQCAICDEVLIKPHVDHDHGTGKIRGLLCGHCNRGLGHFRDNSDLLDRAKQYLERSR